MLQKIVMTIVLGLVGAAAGVANAQGNACDNLNFDVTEYTKKTPKYPGSLGTLSGVYVTSKIAGGYKEYTINGKVTIHKAEIGPVRKVLFYDNNTAKKGYLQGYLVNSNYEELAFCPSTITPNSKESTFSCTFSTKENSSLVKATSPLEMHFGTQAEGYPTTVSYLKSVLKPIKDLPTAPCSTSPDADCPLPNVLADGQCVANPQAGACPGDQVAQLDGSCGEGCGENQVQTLGKCECAENFIKDSSTGTTCVVKPSTAESALPTSGGGSCGLIRNKDL